MSSLRPYDYSSIGAVNRSIVSLNHTPSSWPQPDSSYTSLTFSTSILRLQSGSTAGLAPNMSTGLVVVLANGSLQNASFGPLPHFDEASLTTVIVLSVMFLVSVVGNVATLIQMRRLRRRKSTINTLIVHLAIADLLVTFFCIAGDAVWQITVEWLAGNIACKAFKFMQVFVLYLSAYVTVAISLDRCVAILDPMRRNGASQRVRIMISFAWFFSALFSVPQCLVFNVRRGPFEEDFFQCVTFGNYDSNWQKNVYTIVSLMLMFVLPVAVISTAYALIFITISRKSREQSVMDSIQVPAHKTWVTRWINYKHYLCVALCTKNRSRRSSITSTCSVDYCRGPVRIHLLRKARRKSLRMSIVIVMAFILCWTPYWVVFICTTFLGIAINPIINTFSLIGHSNSLLNPMIYGAFQLCKVQFYNPSSRRKNAWKGTSRKLQSSNQQPTFDIPPDTPASSSSLSRESRNRLLVSECQCRGCYFEAKREKVYLPSLDQPRRETPSSSQCTKSTHKHFTTANVEAQSCLRFHSH